MTTRKTKGKQRVTLELSPESLDVLGDIKRRTGMAQGATIDHLINTFSKTDPLIAAQLHSFCLRQVSSLAHADVSRDPLQRESDLNRENEWKKLARHFGKIAAESAIEKSDLDLLGITVITLGNGKRDLAPANSAIINAGAAELATASYLAWYFSPDHPQDILDAWQGNTIGGTFVYLSTRTDLHLYGQNQPLRFRNADEQEACAREIQELIGFMVGNARNVFAAHKDISSLRFAWALLSMSCNSQQNTGISFPIPRR